MVKPMYIHGFPLKTAAKLPDHWFNPIKLDGTAVSISPKKNRMVESLFSSPLVHPSFGDGSKPWYPW